MKSLFDAIKFMTVLCFLQTMSMFFFLKLERYLSLIIKSLIQSLIANIFLVCEDSNPFFCFSLLHCSLVEQFSCCLGGSKN